MVEERGAAPIGLTQLGGLEGEALLRSPFLAHARRLRRRAWARNRNLRGPAAPAPPLVSQLRKSYVYRFFALRAKNDRQMKLEVRSRKFCHFRRSGTERSNCLMSPRRGRGAPAPGCRRDPGRAGDRRTASASESRRPGAPA